MSEEMSERRRILVPTDFEEPARAALGRALELAPALGAKISILHALDLSTLMAATTQPDVYLGSVATAVRDHTDAALAGLVKSADPERRLIAEARVCEGRPETLILEAARKERPILIVMGTHGRTGFSRLFLGSVAERVVRLASCDVLVVHGKDARD
jgi:nucleotide-binding universal stress UspA family protein